MVDLPEPVAPLIKNKHYFVKKANRDKLEFPFGMLILQSNVIHDYSQILITILSNSREGK